MKPAQPAVASLKLLLPLLASIIAMSPLAIDMYLPAMPIIAEAFATNMGLVQNTLSIYLLGFSLGLLTFGPLADKYSRRAMVIIGLSGFLFASLLLPFCQNIEQFLALRFVQAFISSAASVTVAGTIRELYGKDTAKGLSYVSMIMMLAPMAAPTIGSALLALDGWELIFFSIGSYALIVLLLAYKYLPESTQDKSRNQVSFLGRYKIVFSNSAARLDLLSTMMSSLAFFSYITAIAFIYLKIFGVSELHFSLLFALNVFALMSAHLINTRLVVRKGSRVMLTAGLAVAVLSSVALLLVTYFQLSLVFTVVTIFPLMGSLSMMSVNTDALILTKFPENSGTASAVIGTLKFGIGALAGPILAYFYSGTAMPFAILMVSAILVVLVCQLIHKVKYQNKKEAV